MGYRHSGPKIDELKQAEIGATQENTDILKESISKLRDQLTRIVSISDSVKESLEMKDIFYFSFLIASGKGFKV